MDRDSMRVNFLGKEDYFMSMAFLTAKQNTSAKTPNGACVVNEENKIIGLGYDCKIDGLEDESHAEMNAIINAGNLKNCTIYVRESPCNQCAKMIIQSGIKKVVYYSEKQLDSESPTACAKNMFEMTKVEFSKYNPSNKNNPNEFLNYLKPVGTNEKRHYFMSVAVLTSEQSRDPETQVGACVVNQEDKIIGLGYNGMPGGLEEKFPWVRRKQATKRKHGGIYRPPYCTEHKHNYVCHAEMNAIVSAGNVKNCTVYVSEFPCDQCAKLIILSGIEKVFYNEKKNADKPYTKEAEEKFQRRQDIELSQYKVTIDCEEIDSDY